MATNRRTPAQIAADELAHTKEQLGKARNRVGRLERELVAAKAAVQDLEQLQAYREQHPLLQEQKNEPDPKWAQETARDTEKQATEAKPVTARKTTTRRRTQKG